MKLTEDQMTELWLKACRGKDCMAAFYEVDLELLQRFVELAEELQETNHVREQQS